MTYLYHTSPNAIESINRFGLFGSGLCFASSPYQMSACDVLTYKLDAEGLNFLELSEIEWDDNAIEAAKYLESWCGEMGVSDGAEALEFLVNQNCSDVFEEFPDSIEVEDYADFSFYMQKLALDLSVHLGFDGVSMRDEQGQLYLINMENKLPLLELDTSAGE